MTVICDVDPAGAETLHTALGPESVLVPTMDGLNKHLAAHPEEDVVVLGAGVDPLSAARLAETMRITRPALGVVLVRRRLDTSVLADALRSGVREVVEERDVAGVARAVARVEEVARQIREQIGGVDASHASKPEGRVVSVFSAKGGCGKTTLASNLAAVLADRGHRDVCLVDLDLAFGDVAIVLQLFPTHTIADAVLMQSSLDFPALHALLTPHSAGLTTLVAPLEPGGAESVPASLIARILRLLKAHFDFVVVDTPPAFDDHVLAALDATDIVALIATLDIPAIKNLKLTLETLELLNYPKDRLRIVINRADSKVGLSMNEVEKTLRTSISSQIPSSRDVPASINRGVPIVLDDPKHPVSQAIRTFADRSIVGTVAGETGPVGEHAAERRSVLRRRSRAR
jgi:pilus assembly protein CpaE